MSWSPAHSGRFAADRRQPFDDLFGLIESTERMRAVDLGCGTGEPTHLLHRKLNARSTLGLDSSPEMLRESSEFEGSGLGFSKAHVRPQVDMHQLERRDDVVEWVKGTLLTAWKRALTPLDYEVFLRLYRHRLLGSLTDESPYFCSFKHLLSWGRRDAG